jgi:hypothetical protein
MSRAATAGRLRSPAIGEVNRLWFLIDSLADG